MSKVSVLLWVVLAGCGARPVAGLDGGAGDLADAGAGDADAGPVTLLRRQAMTIVDASGTAVSLVGVNLGGWLLWEGPVWGGGAVGEGDLLRHLSPELLTASEATAFADRIHDTYIVEADIARIAQLGFNVVRVPINHTVLEDDSAPGSYKPAGWERLDRLLSWCETYKVYAVLDLHSAPGGQSRYFFADPDLITRLWDSTALQDRTVALWRAIAGRYRDRDVVAGYDLLNEPDPPTGAALVALYGRIASAIREVDPRHLLFVEGADYARDFSMFSALVDQNSVYSFHMYPFASDTRAAELAAHAALAELQQVPLWCGEFGVNTPAWVAATSAMYDDPKNHVSGRSYWTWKQRRSQTGNFLIGIDEAIPSWDRLMGWTLSQWTTSQPTTQQVLDGVDELAAASALDKCLETSSMVTAIRGR